MARIFNIAISIMIGLASLGITEIATAGTITINSKTFELDQFSGASVTYRTKADGGTVAFDGKLWDNAVGVDDYTLGELAAGQYGKDPGDQISLNNRNTPDWLQLNYAGAGIALTSESEFVIYEISSSTAGVDPEGTSFRISFNGGGWVAPSAGDASFFAASSIPASVENTNQIVFSLKDYLIPGANLQTVRIENTDSGSGTSDPDFIFAAVTASPTVPEPSSLAILGFAGITTLLGRFRLNKR